VLIPQNAQIIRGGLTLKQHFCVFLKVPNIIHDKEQIEGLKEQP